MISCNASGSGTEEIWGQQKSSMLKAVERMCSFTKKHQWWREAWWWNTAVDSAIKEKQKYWKAWNKGGSKEKYQNTKSVVKHGVYVAKF